MFVQNENYHNQELIVKDKTFMSDEFGVFEVPTKVGKLLLTMKGFKRSVMTQETLDADTLVEAARGKVKRAEAKLKEAEGEAAEARQNAMKGIGKFLDPEAGEALAKAHPVPESPPEPPAPEPEEEEEESEEDEESEDEESEEESEEKEEEDDEPGEYPEGEPTMRWKLAELISWAKANNIAADSTWNKAQVYTEIEELLSED